MTNDHFPAGACDTHMHIYDSRYVAASSALLRPPDARISDYRRVQQSLGLQRVVVVQPSTYGLDNACTLDAVAAFGDEARAVVVVDDRVSSSELDLLTLLGNRRVVRLRHVQPPFGVCTVPGRVGPLVPILPSALRLSRQRAGLCRTTLTNV